MGGLFSGGGLIIGGGGLIIGMIFVSRICLIKFLRIIFIGQVHGLVIPLGVNWNLRTPQSTGRNAIKVVQTDGGIVGHVHEPVARRLAPLIRGGEVSHASAEMIGTSRPAPEGTWTQGGGIEIPCKYILKGNRAY